MHTENLGKLGEQGKEGLGLIRKGRVKGRCYNSIPERRRHSLYRDQEQLECIASWGKRGPLVTKRTVTENVRLEGKEYNDLKLQKGGQMSVYYAPRIGENFWKKKGPKGGKNGG